MRVVELAEDLEVEAEALLQLLREMGIRVADADAVVNDADVAKVLAKVERERRAGKDASEAIQAAIEEAHTTTRRRRKRRRRKAPEAEESEEADEDSDDADAGDSDEAEVEDAEAEADESPEASDDEVADEADEGEEPAVEAGDDEVAEIDAETDESDEGDEGDKESAAEEVEEPEAEGADEDADEADADADDEEPAAESDESSDADEEPEAEEEPAKPEPVRENAPSGKVRRIRKPTPAASAGPGGKVRIQAEGYTSDGQRKRRGKKKGKRRQRVDQDAVQENIQRVMAEIKGGGKKKRRRSSRPTQEEIEAAEEQAREEEERERTTVRVNEFLTVAELAELIDEAASEIIGSAFKNLGMMVTINQRLDFDQIELLLDEFDYTAVREEDYGAADEEVEEEEEAPEDLEPRPPVVTIMGHVDHGKTLLLDYIRNTNVVAGEEGGITQHIGAYHVELDDDRTISFLDTPGHAAFTAMRARGADVTDVVILVVAADDSVMPQTIEAISHARNAGVPLIVAINKIDLPAANAMKVKQELLQHEVTVEEFGGDVLAQEVSAKTGEGVDELLEKILLQAELLELKANPSRDAQGTVIEAQLDVGKGPLVSVLVQKGTLRVGDSFICGQFDGRVRALLDERGNNVDEVEPGIPVQVLGSTGVPQAGDTFQVMEPDEAAEIAQTRQRLEREKQLRIKERGIKLGDFAQFLGEGEADTLPLIIKGDVDGSVQAVSDALEQLSTDEVAVEVIHRGVGAINESDILLAGTAGAVVIGFRVRPDTNARNLAEEQDVDIHSYDIIYEAVDDIRAALEGMLAPEEKETILGSAEVREVFKISKVGTIAGCYVTDGVIDRKASARIIRNGVVVYDSEIASLKRFKDDVKEVREGFECGIGIANFNDVKVGDIIECYKVEEIARTLAGAGEGAG